MKKALLLLMIGCIITACSTDDILDNEDDVKELRISAPNYVTTDKLDYDFEIIDGNGDYEISADKEDAIKVTMVGNKVTVHLLTRHSYVTVSDKSDQSVSFTIESTAKELVPTANTLLLPKDKTYTMKIKFGVGGYQIETLEGTSAQAVVTQDDFIKVTAINIGNTYFKIKDRRGTASPFTVVVPSYYDLKDENLQITAINDQRVSITIKTSKTDWTFEQMPTSSLLKDAGLISKGSYEGEYDILQFDTNKEDLKGSTIIYLKDSLGNRASVTVEIK